MKKEDLKKAGLKVTLPRIKILNLLESSKEDHLSAEEVFQRLQHSGEEIGLATVYRVLGQFEQAGLIKRHNFEGDHSVFELDQGEHHDHLVCLKCGSVEEFLDPVIEQQQEKVAEQFKFEITDHSMTLYGICIQCHK